jgi:large subunit ribosomal protein L1
MPEKDEIKKNKKVVSDKPNVEVMEVTETKPKKEVAKAGKRSSKALTEAKVSEEKKLRKTTLDDKPVKISLNRQKPARSVLERRGKKYREAYKSLDKTKTYNLSDAIDLAIKSSTTKFDATVELHIRLGVDPKHADQNIRDNIVLPNGTGKTLKIAVYADDKELEVAKKAGADITMGDTFLEQLEKSIINFDILIATPAMMPKLGKYARILGPKGLMPNPKNGTVTSDTAKAVREAKAGKVEYKIDSSGIVHLGFGKVSFGKDKLVTNAEVVLNSIKANKPSTIKGNYILSVFVSSSMGPSIKIDNNI